RTASANLLRFVVAEDFHQVLAAVMNGRTRLDGFILGSALARGITLGPEAPAIALGDQFFVLVEKLTSIDLLDRSSRETRLMLEQIVKPDFGRELVAAKHRAMPRHVDSCEHRVHA